MTKKFIEKVLVKGIVNTRKYRYKVVFDGWGKEASISRILIGYVGTSEFFNPDNWEKVWNKNS